MVPLVFLSCLTLWIFLSSYSVVMFFADLDFFGIVLCHTVELCLCGGWRKKECVGETESVP